MDALELRITMAARNITATELASRLGCTTRTITRYRDDKLAIPAGIVADLRAALVKPGQRYNLRRAVAVAGFVIGALLARPEMLWGLL